MRKIVIALLAVAGICALAATSLAQSPIGLYGTWASGRYPGVGGQVHLDSVVTNSAGEFVGRVSFSGSPCADWGQFSGRVTGNIVTLSMYVGACGLDVVTLHRGGNAWVGTYQTPNDVGTVMMVQ
jgi:hypothetical protein